MNQNNSALDDLTNGTAASLPPAKETTGSIINGLRTCGPLFSAIFSHNTNDYKDDFQEILSQAKNLIDSVTKNLTDQKINVDDLKKAGINAFCIKVVAESWTTQEEVLPNLSESISQALLKQGISADIENIEFENPLTQELFTNISSSAYIFSALKKHSSINIQDNFVNACMTELTAATKKAIKKLEKFHIPHEDADSVKHHITIEACNILVAIIDRNIENYLVKVKKNSINNTAGTVEPFSFKETGEDFTSAIDVFITSIYVNSRIID